MLFSPLPPPTVSVKSVGNKLGQRAVCSFTFPIQQEYEANMIVFSVFSGWPPRRKNTQLGKGEKREKQERKK